uniref:Uncharacterized protein n=1 Tax=Anguilla anguilla TaxID=7936 RepID=A0A0E9UPC3_ANGAN
MLRFSPIVCEYLFYKAEHLITSFAPFKC